jgi:predicted RNA binding protein YcfA (HicA-like mRNA interferase family)
MTPRLPALRPREVIRALERAGFSLHHVTGSHHYFRHPGRPELRVTVPVHAADLKRGTLAAVIKQAGLTAEEFLDLLRSLQDRWLPSPSGQVSLQIPVSLTDRGGPSQ